MCNFDQNDLIPNRRNCSNDLLGRIITRPRSSRTSYTSNVPLCDHFLLFYWYQMIYQLKNTLKDVINDKCHKCHKCYNSNKCYKILIKYNLSFPYWMLGLSRCLWKWWRRILLVTKFEILVTGWFFVTNILCHFTIVCKL